MFKTTHDVPATKAAQRWKRSSQAMRGRAVARGIFNLVLMIWTVRDIRRRRDDEIKGNRKIWTLAAFAPPIGPIAYFVFGRKRSAQDDGPLAPSDSEHRSAVNPI